MSKFIQICAMPPSDEQFDAVDVAAVVRSEKDDAAVPPVITAIFPANFSMIFS